MNHYVHLKRIRDRVNNNYLGYDTKYCIRIMYKDIRILLKTINNMSEMYQAAVQEEEDERKKVDRGRKDTVH